MEGERRARKASLLEAAAGLVDQGGRDKFLAEAALSRHRVRPRRGGGRGVRHLGFFRMVGEAVNARGRRRGRPVSAKGDTTPRRPSLWLHADPGRAHGTKLVSGRLLLRWTRQLGGPPQSFGGAVRRHDLARRGCRRRRAGGRVVCATAKLCARKTVLMMSSKI